VNVSRQLADPSSLLSLYRRLLAYRRSSPALQLGRYEAIDGAPADCYVFIRQAGEDRVLVALNFSDEERTVGLPHDGPTVLALSSEPGRERSEVGPELRIGGHRGVVIELR
jgi:alpha-glucosidase